MSFLHTGLLLGGLACVSIPIIIHLLLRQRRKPIRWGAMRFLLEAYRKQRRKLRIQHLLLLITRCLIIALLALALGRPLLEQAGLLGGATGTTLYVLVDNSLASTVRDAQTGETALDRHKEEARGLLDGLGVGDRAALIALGGPAEGVVVPPSSDLPAVGALVRELRPTDSQADIERAIEQVAADIGEKGVDERGRVVVAILSEFLEGSADPSRSLSTALQDVDGVQVVASKPAAVGAPNVQILSVEPLSPVILTGTGGASGRGARENVRVRLRRTGAGVNEAALTTVRLRASGARGGGVLAGTERAMVQQVFRWKPGQSEGEVTLQIEPAAMALRENVRSNVLIAEIDRDAVAGDNTYRRPVALREALQVGVIGRRRFGGIGASIEELTPADWIRLALRPSDSAPIDLMDIDPASIDAPILAALDAIFVTSPARIAKTDWQKLRGFVDAGGLLVVCPSVESQVQAWTDVFAAEMGVGWRIAREAVQTSDEGVGLDEEVGQSAILSMLRGELTDLIKPVTVWRMLPLEDWDERTDVLLSTSDGVPWIVAARVGDDEAAPNGAETNGSRSNGDSGNRQASGREEDDAARGLVVYLASAPSPTWTNVQATPLMLPLVQEIGRQGFGLAAGSWATHAGLRAELPQRTSKVLGVEGGELEVGLDRMTSQAVRYAGLWEARDEAGRHLGFIAVNADAEAGRTQVNDPSQIESWLGAVAGETRGGMTTGQAPNDVVFLDPASPTDVYVASEADSPLSLPLLVAVFVLAVLEVLMARVFSHARVETGGATPIGAAGGAVAVGGGS